VLIPRAGEKGITVESSRSSKSESKDRAAQMITDNLSREHASRKTKRNARNIYVAISHITCRPLALLITLRLPGVHPYESHERYCNHSLTTNAKKPCTPCHARRGEQSIDYKAALLVGF